MTARDIRYGRRGGRWAEEPGGDMSTIREKAIADGTWPGATSPEAPAAVASLFDVPVDATYRHVPPTATATALAMQAKALPRSGTFKAAMYDAIRTSVDGLTDYDLEDVLGRSHQSTSGCRNALMNDGWITPARNADNTIRTRTNRYGNDATVWVAHRRNQP